MTTPQIPQSIQASIHQDAINRVSQFFNATTSDILNELLQNTRRSGATKVDITTTPGLVTLTDDGAGIKDPSTLLAFGQTGWDEKTALSEHPAGMGLYALARCKVVTVSSKPENGEPWQVTLTPDHFVGKLTAPVERVHKDTVSQGTTITFTTDAKEQHIHKEVTDAARYYPLPVYFNSEKVCKVDFLISSEHVEEWQGVRIGVHKTSNDRMNFYGVVIKDPRLPRVQTIDKTMWTTQVNVTDCPQLELTLPARREVVETPFMEELRQACRRTIYKAMSLQPEPVQVPKKVQDDAAAMGITLPDPAPELIAWQPSQAHYANFRSDNTRKPVHQDTIVLDVELSPANQQALARAAEQNGATHRLYTADDRLTGYKWYDQITKADKVSITVTDETGDRTIDETNKDPRDLARQRPDRIIFTLHSGPEENPQEILALPSDTAFGNEEGDDVYDSAPLVTKDSAITVGELSEMIMDGFFCPIDDLDSDSYDTQEDNARLECDTTAIRMLSSHDEAVKAAIINAVEHEVIHQVPTGMTATIQISRGQPTTVTLVKNTPEPHQAE